jgi:hydrogenase nickel incorporation protein HypA/HybF
MHELSIALSILDVATEEAERHDGRVRAIHLRLGPLSGVVKEALQSAYELAREGSALPDAELVIEEVPLAVCCPTCKAEYTAVSGRQLSCPTCGTPACGAGGGRELEIVALEIES